MLTGEHFHLVAFFVVDVADGARFERLVFVLHAGLPVDELQAVEGCLAQASRLVSPEQAGQLLVKLDYVVAAHGAHDQGEKVAESRVSAGSSQQHEERQRSG